MTNSSLETPLWVKNINTLVKNDSRKLADLCYEMRITQAHFYNILGGRSPNCGIRTFSKIAKVLGVGMDELFYEKKIIKIKKGREENAQK